VLKCRGTRTLTSDESSDTKDDHSAWISVRRGSSHDKPDYQVRYIMNLAKNTVGPRNPNGSNIRATKDKTPRLVNIRMPL